MQRYTFKIIYDLEKDIKNWITAVREVEFAGKKWRDGLFGPYLREFDKISVMNDEEAKEELQKYITANFYDKINKAKFMAMEQLSENFLSACNYIEEITGRRLAFNRLKFLLTTFPRAPYSTENGSMYFCVFWENIISTFLHEMLHVQVYKYWRINPNSIISNLTEQEFLALNESITFLANGYNNMHNMQSDSGYPEYSELRLELEEQWNRTHDFERLLVFGVNYIKQKWCE